MIWGETKVKKTLPLLDKLRYNLYSKFPGRQPPSSHVIGATLSPSVWLVRECYRRISHLLTSPPMRPVVDRNVIEIDSGGQVSTFVRRHCSYSRNDIPSIKSWKIDIMRRSYKSNAFILSLFSIAHKIPIARVMGAVKSENSPVLTMKNSIKLFPEWFPETLQHWWFHHALLLNGIYFNTSTMQMLSYIARKKSIMT